MKKSNKLTYSVLIILMIGMLFSNDCKASELTDLGLHVIPYPQKVEIGGDNFSLLSPINIILDRNYSKIDLQTAEYLKKELQYKWGLIVKINENTGGSTIKLTRKGAPKLIGTQGYVLSTESNKLTINAKKEVGLFYGVQTLFQLIKKSRGKTFVPGMKITDWPDVKTRAAHYDTKRHQDKASYVKSFIRDLAKYKINMLVWEWEDKLEYKSHPKIGAPGTFTIEEMQEFTKYARKYHVELVPLVQGIGHVSFILKWEKYWHLREVADSDWQFCILKDGTYDVLFDLWDEAIEATPGSKYIHIGSDETFELGLCTECQAKAKEVGVSGLYHIFANKASKHLEKKRKVMIWERPMGWVKHDSPLKNMKVDKDLVLTESYGYETPDFKYARMAKDMGFELFIYDPNPGLEPLFLPYHFRLQRGERTEGSLESSYNTITTSAKSKLFDGMINTSWDDSGLHNQMWMLSFVTSAQYSWNATAPYLDEFQDSFFASYYGDDSINMKELYELLNEGSYYYAWSFERNVWHHGVIGKTHLPDMPRGQHIEYDEYWNEEYKDKIEESKEQREKMARALQIINKNKELNLENSYDFEIYKSIAELIDHTCQTYLDLSNLELTIKKAHRNAFSNRKEAYNNLIEAEQIIENSLKRREEMFNKLTTTWEKTRLPKGMSTPDKQFFFKMDRSRHFANRTPDLSFLILDEQLLDMEGYLERLKEYRKSFQIEF